MKQKPLLSNEKRCKLCGGVMHDLAHLSRDYSNYICMQGKNAGDKHWAVDHWARGCEGHYAGDTGEEEWVTAVVWSKRIEDAYAAEKTECAQWRKDNNIEE